ncbi:glutathione S-transferase Mu 1-like [Penaeus indicus]|uniref:glutathione S-transferase Mu 1-like n=1 Tax=Penaeus indicus TaxID=29960 RepID=UPI00300D8332
MAPVLGYWKTRALCQAIRLMLRYTGTEYEEKFYPVGDAPGYDKSEWLSVKFKLGLAFPNLPYYIDGDVKISQSKAIMRYLARKHDLCGTTPEEVIRTDMLEYQLADMQNAFFDVTYEHYDQKDSYTASLPAKMKQYSDFLGGSPWFAGDKLTYIDFLAYEIFDQHLCLDRTCLDGFKNLQAFQKRFEDLEPIRKYMASPEFFRTPICNKYAQFTIAEGK